MDKKRRKTWYLIGISSLLILALMLVSSILDIGERLRGIHLYVEIAFYVLITIVVFFLIINPIRIILKSPSMEIDINKKPSNKEKKAVKTVCKNIIKHNDLDEKYVNLLKNSKSYEERILNLQVVFNDCLKKDLNKIIIKHAKTVLISTAICQNSKIDMFAVVTCNTNMIKELVSKLGFRPSLKSLSKLVLNVVTTALIAEGLESITLDDILPKGMSNALSEIPLVKPILSSVTQGSANALLTIRIGCVARRFLFKDGSVITKEDIRKQAYKESLLLIPQVIGGTLTFLPKKMVSIFGKNKKKSSDDTNSDGSKLVVSS